MSLWRQLTRGLTVLVRRERSRSDLDDEIADYRERRIAEFQRAGHAVDEARRLARLEMGDALAVREHVRDAGWEHALDTLWSDVRFGARQLRRNPSFAAAAVLTLALGIGAGTAIFSAVHPILLEPLPYPSARRLVAVWDHGGDGSRLAPTFGTFREILARSRAFESLAVTRSWQPTLTGALEPERLEGQRVSAGYFDVLGVTPALGAPLATLEDHPGGARLAIIADGLWQRRFGGDRTVIGREIVLDGDGYTVIGILPRTFENVLAPDAQVWTLLQYDPSLPPDGPEWGHHLRLVGRLRAGLDVDDAERDLESVARTTSPEFARPPWASLDEPLIVSELREDVTRDVRPALIPVMGAVFLLLLLACVNVGNLLLARGAQRRGELALRAALGAGRGRLVRQLVVETLLLAFLGGAGGVALARLGVSALVRLAPAELPRAGSIAIDVPVLAFALALTTGIGLAVGIASAMSAARAAPTDGLRRVAPRTVGGDRRTRGALVIAEVALAGMLLVGSGLILRSLQRLFAVEPGFVTEGLVTMQVQTAGHRLEEGGAIARFFAAALNAVRDVPGVRSAALTSQLPLSGDADLFGVHMESSPTNDPNAARGAFRYAVSPGYFETMGIPLRRGRLLELRDDSTAPPVVVISESLARQKFPGVDPIGQRLRVGPNDGPWSTIVGVVGDVRQVSLAVSQPDAVYMTTTQWRFPDRALWVVVRGTHGVSGLAPLVRAAIRSVDRDQPIVRASTMPALVRRSASERRFALVIFQAFALVAVVLAGTGMYGILAGGVVERTREIGVRAALGASQRSILGLVARQAAGITAVGVGVGLLAAAGGSAALRALLFGVSRLDPLTYGGAVLLLALVALAASLAPARRALRVDPAIALRGE